MGRLLKQQPGLSRNFTDSGTLPALRCRKKGKKVIKGRCWEIHILPEHGPSTLACLIEGNDNIDDRSEQLECSSPRRRHPRLQGRKERPLSR